MAGRSMTSTSPVSAARSDDWWLDGKLPENPTISKAIVDATRQHPMAAWMIGGQTANDYYDRAPWQFIGPKWEARTQALVDRTHGARIRYTRSCQGCPRSPQGQGPTPQLARSFGTKRRQPPNRPMTVAVRRPRRRLPAPSSLMPRELSALAGKLDEAYDGLAAYPFKTSAALSQKALLPLGQYLVGQGMVEEARRFRDRLLTDDLWAAIKDDNGTRDALAQLAMWAAEDALNGTRALAHHTQKTGLPILNFLPAKDLRAMAKNETMFTPEERALLVRTAWTRTYARGAVPEKSLTRGALCAQSEVKAVADKVAADYPRMQDANRRLLTMLRTPRMGVLVNAPGVWEPVTMTGGGEVTMLDSFDHNDKNWWCPFETRPSAWRVA